MATSRTVRRASVDPSHSAPFGDANGGTGKDVTDGVTTQRRDGVT